MQGAIDAKGVIALCRCFASSKFPLCNGAHNKHNEEHCDNAGPLVLKRLGGGAEVAPKGDKEDDLKDLQVCRLRCSQRQARNVDERPPELAGCMQVYRS